MIPAIEPIYWLALTLVFQPLIALIWLYIFIRLVTAHISQTVAKTVDSRVEHAVNQIKRHD